MVKTGRLGGDAMRKIILCGDSIMKGVVWSTELQRYTMAGKERFDQFLQKGVELKNLSKMGATVGKGLKVLKLHLTERLDDTDIVLEFGGNDCDHDWEAVSGNPEGEHQPFTLPADFVRGLSDCVAYCRDLGARVWISALPPLHAGRYAEWISRGRSKANILKWLGDEHMLYRWHEFYGLMVRKVANELGCAVIALDEMFLTSHRFPELICVDGIHPSEQGHQMIATALAQQLL